MSPAIALSKWYERVQRPLPWRKTQDPYAIWISEVMLQQTQVGTVIPYYEAFMQRFPNIQRLARAEEQDVLRLWAGLGYYSRARNLHRGAGYVVSEYDGRFPRDLTQVRSIPGIGPYTAGAILSIAFDLPVAAVDGNVQRVLARYHLLDELLESKTAQLFFWKTAQEWVERAKSPRVLNQAIMELGATVCTKAEPRCWICPLSENCKAKQTGRQKEFPRRKPRRAMEHLWWTSLVQENSGRILLIQRTEKEWWSGLWDFPHLQTKSEKMAEKEVRAFLKKNPDCRLDRQLDQQEHTVTHHRIHVSAYLIQRREKTETKTREIWLTPKQAKDLPLSALAKKVLSSL